MQIRVEVQNDDVQKNLSLLAKSYEAQTNRLIASLNKSNQRVDLSGVVGALTKVNEKLSRLSVQTDMLKQMMPLLKQDAPKIDFSGLYKSIESQTDKVTAVLNKRQPAPQVKMNMDELKSSLSKIESALKRLSAPTTFITNETKQRWMPYVA